MLEYEMLSMPVAQLLGLAGAVTYVANYTLITLRQISTESVTYFIMNLCAASMVLISLTHAFNAAALVIQVFFIGVSLCGIVTRVRRRPSAGIGNGPRLRPLT